MMPYKWPIATAIPENPQIRREIVKAARMFLEDGDEQLRRRRAEIASIRQGLEEIARDVAKLRRDAPALLLWNLRKYGYNPEEARVPKGNPGPGRWTNSSGNASAGNNSAAAYTQIAAAGGLRCDGFPSGCQNGGSYGTSGMYNIDGRILCIDCAIKFFCLQDEPQSERNRMLDRFLIGR